MRSVFLSTLTVLILTSRLDADPAKSAQEAIIDRFVSASQAQQSRLQGASMEVDIEAEVPKLKKRGRLHALRKISELGRITYDLLRFEGDRSIKNEVIARYLSADAEARDARQGALAISPTNYKFKYKGMVERDDRLAHIFQVAPRQKKVGLYTGELWIDSETFLPLRESGRFVKSPSIFLKKVEFVREFDIRDGVAIPRRLESLVDTRLIGKALLSVAYSAVSLPEAAPTVVFTGDSQ